MADLGGSSAAGVVYIAGHGRSGSTLLDVVLAQHPEIVGLGEVHRLSLDPDVRICADGHPVSESPFWAPVIAAVCDRAGVDVGSWPRRLPTTTDRGSGPTRALLDIELLVASIPSAGILPAVPPLSAYLTTIRNSLRFIDEAASFAGTSWAVDSTKNPARMKAMWLLRPDAVRVVHLVRDGRAHAASNRRRNRTPVEVSAARWAAENRKVRLALATVPPSSRLVVRYEDLCGDLPATIEGVLDLLGVDRHAVRDPATPRHQIPGNEWLLSIDGGTIDVKVDDVWRSDWSAADEAAFRTAAGREETRYGYGPASIMSA